MNSNFNVHTRRALRDVLPDVVNALRSLSADLKAACQYESLRDGHRWVGAVEMLPEKLEWIDALSEEVGAIIAGRDLSEIRLIGEPREQEADLMNHFNFWETLKFVRLYQEVLDFDEIAVGRAITGLKTMLTKQARSEEWPTRMQIVELRALECALRKLKGEELPQKVFLFDECPTCGGRKLPFSQCRGNDQCMEGPEGQPAEHCEHWGPFCCRCGQSYALGQI